VGVLGQGAYKITAGVKASISPKTCAQNPKTPKPLHNNFL
jgi:hypothetical protein